MRAVQGGIAFLGCLVMSSTLALAQEGGDRAAWLAMMFTPYGALPQGATREMAAPLDATTRPRATFEFRFAQWRSDAGDLMWLGSGLSPGAATTDNHWSAFAVGGRVAHIGFTGAFQACHSCTFGISMASLDYEANLLRSSVGFGPSGSSFALGLRPTIGYGHNTAYRELTAYAGNVDVPISVTIPTGRFARFVPFISPGVGYGRFKTVRGTDSGTRAAFSGGLTFIPSPQFAIHAAWRQIFYTGAPSTHGFSVTFGR